MRGIMKLYLWLCLLYFYGCQSYYEMKTMNFRRTGMNGKISMHLKVGLTRERGANNKLRKLLPDLECVEIPCITFAATSEREKLRFEVIVHDLAVITSPQSASVFVEEVKKLPNLQKLKVVAIGKGTSKPLIAAGIIPVFEPSGSLGETLAQELPASLGNKVLYPCSELAEDKIPTILREKGFQVTRLNTYTTVPEVWNESDYQLARSIQIVTFGSPSTVKIWKERVGTNFPVVAIGSTSFKAAKQAGFQEVYCPPSPSIEAWANTIQEVALQKKKDR